MTDEFSFDEFNAFSGPRTALKSAINMKDLVDGRPFRFQLDEDNFFAEDEEDLLDEGDYGKNKTTYRMYEDPELQWQDEDPNVIRLDAKIGNYDELEKKMTAIHESGHVKKLMVKEGNTIAVKEDAKIFIHYAAFAEGKEDAFDKTNGFGRKSPLGVFLTGEELVLGLQIGLKTMHIGEISKFMIYPPFAYGELGCPPRIAAGARVVFTVELLRFIPKEKFGEVLFMSADARAELPFKDILDTALSCKGQGNVKYYDGDYHGALRHYSRAIDFLENYPTKTEEDNSKRDAELPEICCNKAQCLLRLESPARACVAIKLGLRTTDENTRPKLLIRFAEAKYMLNAYEEALEYCKDAVNQFRELDILEEKHTALLRKVRSALYDQRDKEKFLCRKMLNMTTEPSNSKSKPGRGRKVYRQ